MEGKLLKKRSSTRIKICLKVLMQSAGTVLSLYKTCLSFLLLIYFNIFQNKLGAKRTLCLVWWLKTSVSLDCWKFQTLSRPAW